MNGIVLVLVVMLLVPLCVDGTIYYVDDKRGSDSNGGQGLTNAFKTISTCISALTDPGDECHIRTGRYHEPEFLISNKQGNLSHPIIIRGYENEIPVIDGTIPLTPKEGFDWTLGIDGIYSAQIEQDIWQLFVDDEMMTNARWPNALWSDKTVFLNEYWAKSDSNSTRGEMVDSGEKNLTGSGLNATGAIAVLNVGSFNTFTAVVQRHVPGQNNFTYNDTFGGIKFKPNDNQYFLEDKLELLDNAGEWFYDKTAKTVYLKTIDGNSPEGRIRGKVTDGCSLFY